MQTVKLLRREEVAEGTMSFYFDKPAGFQFKPGQYIDLTLIDPPDTDAEGNNSFFGLGLTGSQVPTSSNI